MRHKFIARTAVIHFITSPWWFFTVLAGELQINPWQLALGNVGKLAFLQQGRLMPFNLVGMDMFSLLSRSQDSKTTLHDRLKNTLRFHLSCQADKQKKCSYSCAGPTVVLCLSHRWRHVHFRTERTRSGPFGRHLLMNTPTVDARR
jgi:hypothetical protein